VCYVDVEAVCGHTLYVTLKASMHVGLVATEQPVMSKENAVLPFLINSAYNKGALKF